MPNINQLLSTAKSNSSISMEGGSQLEQKQAWLHILEKSDLLNALRNTLVMEAAVDKVSGVQPDEREWSPLNRPLKDGNSYAIAPHQVAKSDEAGTSILAKQQNSDIKVSMNMPENFLNSVSIQRVTTSQVGGQKLSGLLSGDFLVTPDSIKWALRNVVVLRSGPDVEVWVRDLNLPNAKLLDFLKGLRQNMGSLGVSLARVVLNGHELFSKNKILKNI